MMRYMRCRHTSGRQSGHLVAAEVKGAAVVAVLFAIGGTVRLLMWSLPHPAHWWALILLAVLVTWMIRSRVK